VNNLFVLFLIFGVKFTLNVTFDNLELFVVYDGVNTPSEMNSLLYHSPRVSADNIY